MNLAICTKEGKLKKLVINAIMKDGRIVGENAKVCLKPDKYELIWTDKDTITPIYENRKDKNGETKSCFVGYEETNKDFTPLEPPGHLMKNTKMTHQDRIDIYEKLEDIAKMSFSDLDAYIDNITDIKAFLKKQAKVTLAIIKLIEEWQ